MVIIIDELAHDTLGVFQAQGAFGVDGLLLERLVEALQFAVGLRVIRTSL